MPVYMHGTMVAYMSPPQGMMVKVTYPAAYEIVIAVGAIDQNDQRCGFSNWGPKLRISDWHNMTFNPPFTLIANETYNYTIQTGSYPQVYHTRELPTANSWINCTKFTDVNGM